MISMDCRRDFLIGQLPGGFRRIFTFKGLSQSDALMQLQSDMLGINVQRPLITEVAALGAAMVGKDIVIGSNYSDSFTLAFTQRADSNVQDASSTLRKGQI